MKKSGDQLTLNLVPHVEGGVTQEMGGVNCLLWAIGRDANMVDLHFKKTGTAVTLNGGGERGVVTQLFGNWIEDINQTP